jgi:hypothetical protein
MEMKWVAVIRRPFQLATTIGELSVLQPLSSHERAVKQEIESYVVPAAAGTVRIVTAAALLTVTMSVRPGAPGATTMHSVRLGQVTSVRFPDEVPFGRTVRTTVRPCTMSISVGRP